MNIFRLVGRIFLPIGILMVGAGGYLAYGQFVFAQTAARTEGVVIDVVRDRSAGVSTRQTSAALVRFIDAKGATHQFAEAVSSNPPAHQRGEIVPVLYAPDAPDTAYIDSFLGRFFLPTIFGSMGAVLIILGGALLTVDGLKQARIRHLLRHGRIIQARFQRQYTDTTLQMNGRSPCRIVVEAIHPASGKLEEFISEPVWKDLPDALKLQPIAVHIDVERPQIYHVDLRSFLGERR